jgi:epoxide hydrolase-like predicted phosphatase
MTFRAVVFDYGGTLTVPYRDNLAAFAVQHPDIDFEILRDMLAPVQGGGDDTLLTRAERGEVELDELIAHLEERQAGLGVVLHPDTTPLANLALEPQMAQLVADARAAGFRTGVLSNIFSGMHWLYQLKHDDWDAVVFSSAVRMRKPEPAIYRHVCELMDVTPEQTLYLDDFPDMCAGARAVGMTAVLVDDHAKAVAEARRILGLVTA